jgi:hypothetical protein
LEIKKRANRPSTKINFSVELLKKL